MKSTLPRRMLLTPCYTCHYYVRQWSSDAVELVNRELGPETNLLYDYLSPSSFGPDPLLAGPRSGLTFRRAGKVLVYSFNLQVSPNLPCTLMPTCSRFQILHFLPYTLIL